MSTYPPKITFCKSLSSTYRYLPEKNNNKSRPGTYYVGRETTLVLITWEVRYRKLLSGKNNIGTY